MNVALMLIVYSSLVSVNALIPFLVADGIVLSQATLVAQSFVDVHVVDDPRPSTSRPPSATPRRTEGRSIRSDVGAESKGVSRSREASRRARRDRERGEGRTERCVGRESP
eukprot:31205-Pelagococcus_subviridis.AAC.13